MITEQRCLSLLTKCKTLDVVKHIHALLLKTALDADPLLAGKLILHCAITISDVLDYACRFFLHFPNPDVFMYNTLIRGHAESDSPQNSLVTYIEMRRTLALPPDSFSLAFAFKAAANIRCLPTGVQLHCQAVIHGLDGHLFVGTTMISVYAECGCLRFARKVFEEMFEPNVIAWNAVLTACFRCGDVKAAEIMFGRMTERNSTSWNVMVAGYMKAGEMELAKKVFMEMPLKDGVSWSTLIVGCGHHGCFDQAFGFFREMHRVGLRPNEVSLTGVLSACAHAGAFEFGRILHAYVEKAGLAWMITVNNALLDMYSKCGNIHMACFVFERMAGRKNIVTWTSMIAGLAMQGCGEKAICFFHQMEESGITPDGIAFISILYACSHAGLVDEGQRLFSRMKSVYGIEPAIEHYGCMVDLYGRAGRLHKAYEFINQMQMPPTAIIWRTLLGACSIHKNVELAEQVNKKLSEIDPNNCSDHILLSNVYAVVGKWKDVAAVRRTMKTQRIQKTPGWSIIEINKVLYSFTAGKVEGNTVWEEAYEKLKEIMLKLRLEEGYAPEVGSVLHDIGEEEKEDALSRHSEKLAVAFGMSRLFKGKVIRIVKNLRICRDCHLVMKLISKVYGLEIVVRDRSRFHSIGNGMCSCRDYW